jgi:hypothetical protein
VPNPPTPPTGVYTPENSASLGAQNIHVSNRQVITGNRDIEIVFQRKTNCIFQRQIQFAVPNQLR